MKVRDYLNQYKENKRMRDFSEYADVLSLTSKSRKEKITFQSNQSLNKQLSESQSPNNYASLAKRKQSSIGKRIKTTDDENWEDFASKQLTLIEKCIPKPIAIINLSVLDKGKQSSLSINLYEDSNIDLIIRRISLQYHFSTQKEEELRQQIFKFLY